jgi:glycosyltransferase involved in cell wall biosynthesis
MKKRLLFIQFAGDYRDAVQRFAQGGDETYYAQKYSVNFVAELAQKVDEVATLCCLTDSPYDELLENGVRAIGAGFKETLHLRSLLRLIETYQPTHIVLRAPLEGVIRWAIQKKLKIFLTLADSFGSRGLRNTIRNYQLRQLLNHPQVDWVGNHGLTASKSLEKMGVDPKKIIPWDWPHVVSPSLFLPKDLPPPNHIFTLMYVGGIYLSKGLGDVLMALSMLRDRGISVQLKVAGTGDQDLLMQQCCELNLLNAVTFLGLIPNVEVVPQMREADLVVVPSRHEYPEGFPMTIYETLCSRTPLIVSDHPMFMDHLKHEVNALIFPAGNAMALSKNIEKLFNSPHLYSKLSIASHETWERLQLTAKWGDIVYHWLEDTPENWQWLSAHSLAAKAMI